MRRDRRRSIRIPGRNYATPGFYYVTLCIHQRRCLLGAGIGGSIVLSPAGRAVEAVWLELPRRFRHVYLDTFVLMPNHLHGIIGLRRIQDGGQDRLGEPLSEIVRWFKAQSTRVYIHGVRQQGWPRFDGRFWQRGYYEHVVRGEEDLAHARGYMWRNPRRWHSDPDNPDADSDLDPATPWDV